jgi:cell division protein FtsQ
MSAEAARPRRASTGAASIVPPAITVSHPPSRRGWLRRRSNRRITAGGPRVGPWLARGFQAVLRKLAVVAKALAVVALLSGAMYGGRRLVRGVIGSPRFAVREVRVGATIHVSRDDLRALAGVRIGDHLLTVDPDVVAARIATHPWIAAARVRRELPSTVAIDVTERRAVACALLGALYLVDGAGLPFKRATLDEADGLTVLTGVNREQYAAMRTTSEAVFRQQLALLDAYETDGAERPKLSEIHVDAREGFTAVLLDGGGEIRFGRGEWPRKLGALDQILAALGARGPASLSIVYLDGAATDRVTVRMKPAPTDDPELTVAASKKFRSADKRGED